MPDSATVDNQDKRVTLSREERNFAREMRRLRLAMNLNQKQFADALSRVADTGIDQAAVSRIESERRVVRMIEGQAIAKLLDTTVWNMMHPDTQDHLVADARAMEQQLKDRWNEFGAALNEFVDTQIEAQVLTWALRSTPVPEDADPDAQLLRDDALERLEELLSYQPSSLARDREQTRETSLRLLSGAGGDD